MQALDVPDESASPNLHNLRAVFRLMTRPPTKGGKAQKDDDRHFCCTALCEAQRSGYDGLCRRALPGALPESAKEVAMFHAAPCNTALAVLIVLAALGPAIVDVARLAKCAIVPCRNKERI
jgi:hypothetical protein